MLVDWLWVPQLGLLPFKKLKTRTINGDAFETVFWNYEMSHYFKIEYFENMYHMVRTGSIWNDILNRREKKVFVLHAFFNLNILKPKTL